MTLLTALWKGVLIGGEAWHTGLYTNYSGAGTMDDLDGVRVKLADLALILFEAHAENQELTAAAKAKEAAKQLKHDGRNLQFQGFHMPAGLIYADEGYAVTKEEDVD